jgi:hypothetical protein
MKILIKKIALLLLLVLMPLTLSAANDSTKTQFDEADSLFGKRVEVQMIRVAQNDKSQNKRGEDYIRNLSKRQKRIDHRSQDNKNSRSNEVVNAKRGKPKLPAPTKVTLVNVTNHSLSINWYDNATIEYGVALERGIPTHSIKGVNYHWVRIANIDERIGNNINGKGWRSDYDSNLKSNTIYCYRLKSYFKENQQAIYQFSKPSYPVCVFTR